jgi:hypothetical protein
MTGDRPVALNFRTQTLLHLSRNGLNVFDPHRESETFAELHADTDQWTDIGGVSPWVIQVRGGATGDALSKALTEADEEARAAGSDWGVAILRRRGHDTEGAYALMTLKTFTKVLKGEAPRPPKPPRPVTGIAG